LTLPSESLRAVKRTREFLRSILTENRRPQFALKELASSCLRHYPFDFNLDKYWSEDVCLEHGNDRIFCRECKQHECSTESSEVQHDCSKLVDLLLDIQANDNITKYRKGEITATIVDVTSDNIQVNEHKEEEV